mmetsp:Transcript_40606/g.72000  ORF Transcript_40606/g.72000 Transcript_40606/m.72000 type:complete len:220 (-) Transcript_40606:182-841(-)
MRRQHRTAFLLACLACASQGRRVQSSSGPAAADQTPPRSRNLKALEMFLHANSAAGFNPSIQGVRPSPKQTTIANTHPTVTTADVIDSSEARGHGAALAAGLALCSAVEPALAAEPLVGDIGFIEPLRATLATVCTVISFVFLVRTILSWFPSYNLNEYPWVLFAAPTEPFLIRTRKIFPPVSGIDISPLVCFGVVSIFLEFVVSKNGVLAILAETGGY